MTQRRRVSLWMCCCALAAPLVALGVAACSDDTKGITTLPDPVEAGRPPGEAGAGEGGPPGGGEGGAEGGGGRP